MRSVLFLCSVFLWPGFEARAAAPSIISNLANPAIGFNALFLGAATPDLDQPDGLRFQEAELSLISTVDPSWTLAGNLVFDDRSAVAEEAYATTTSLPGLAVKVGELRASFGKQGLLHTHAFPFVAAPVVSANVIGAEGFKDAGVEAAWLSPLPWYAELTAGAYRAQPASPDHAMEFGGTAHGNVPALAHVKNLVDLDDDTTLEAGGSALDGIGADGLHHAAWGADLTVRHVPLRQANQRGWTATAEWLRKAEYGGGSWIQDARGWFGSMQYRWAQCWWTGARAQEAYASFTDALVGATGSPEPGHVRGAAANVSWLPSEFSQLRLEWEALTATGIDGRTSVDRRYLLQLSFIIGFHPPHAY